jgi:uncharacterized membrane protein
MQNEKQHKWLPRLFLIISGLGFLDATSLTVDHYTSATLPCTITHGCQIVTSSAYSEIVGVPVALLGALYYLSIFLATCVWFETKSEKLLQIISEGTILGFAASLWFVSLQLFVLHAICQYCMFSAGTSTLLFALGLMALKLARTPRHDA